MEISYGFTISAKYISLKERYIAFLTLNPSSLQPDLVVDFFASVVIFSLMKVKTHLNLNLKFVANSFSSRVNIHQICI